MLTSSVYGRKVSAVNKQALNGVAFKKKCRKNGFGEKGGYATPEDVVNRKRYLKNQKTRMARFEEERRVRWREEQKKLVARTLREVFGDKRA